MSLPGLSATESLSLQRSVGTQNTGFIPELTPVESGEYINRSLNSGATSKDIAEWCGLEAHSKMPNEFKNLFLHLEENLHHLICSGVNKKLGQVPFDRARIISTFPQKHQEQILFATLEYNFTRRDIQGIKQKMERSDMKIKEIIKEMADRKGQNLVVNFFVYIHDKKFKEKINNTIQTYRDKLFANVLEDRELLDIISNHRKKIINGTLGKKHYSLLITGNNLSVDLKKQIEKRIEDLLY
jgi:hypothetical protein